MNEENLSSPQADVLALLLRPTLPDVRKQMPTKQFKVDRLSELTGQDVILTLTGLPYDKFREVQDKPLQERALQLFLFGCVEPSFRDERLLDASRGIVTPLDAIRARFSVGEIDEVAVEVQRLSGYLKQTLTEIKNA